MQEVAELIRIWIEGASWEDIRAAEGFQLIVLSAAWLIPASIIALGFGAESWRELPLARALGFAPPAEDGDWVERARDLDKDGTYDI